MDDSVSKLGLMHSRTAAQQQFERNLRQLADAGQARRGTDEEKKALMEACQGFETILLAKLWQQMRSTIPKEGSLHGNQEEFYLSMFDHEVANSLAAGKGVGIARMMYEQLGERLDAASAKASRTSMVGLESIPSGPSGAVGRKEPFGPAAENGGSIGAGPASVWERPSVPAGTVGWAPQEGADTEAAGQTAGAEQAGPPGMPTLVWPVEGKVSSGFGWRKDPFTGRKAWHAGVDLVADKGTPVHACWPGRVSFVGEWAGYGQAVVLEHENGWMSIYAHNSRNLVKLGQEVGSGEQIARMGSSGRSTGPHLHFELRQGEISWDPLQVRQRLLAGLEIGRRS
jgi:peptidoglycan hydrolase FlgJ